MADDHHPMTEEDIAALVSAEIEDSLSYDRTELDESRVKAIEYKRGEMNDLPAEEGRSSVTDHTVQDVIGWIIPGLMRVFFGADEVATYEPQSKEDEATAKQATDYVNNIVLKECNAYQVFWDAFSDALLHGNGVIKHFWDPTPVTKVQVMSCITEDQMAQVLQSDDVEVLEHTERDPVEIQLHPDMPPEPIVYHDLKVKVVTAKGTLKLMAIPPEEFLIDRDAVDIEDARFCAHRTMKTRSELIQMGFDRDEVDDLPGFGSPGSDSVSTARKEGDYSPGYPGKDRASEQIELFECYIETDHDGDGETEMLRVYAAGPSASKVLDWDVWEDDRPFSDLTPERVPHRWQGRSVFDDTQDVQRIKTVLQRNLLDNIYQTNIPDRAVDITRIDNPDALFDRRIGNVIRVTDGDPSTAVSNLEVPFTAVHSFTALEYFDSVIERRTGISKASQGLDPEVLQNQSATAANIQQSASYSKIELIARNVAEMGMKRVFRAILRLVVKHQDRPRTVRLRNEWVEMDPRGWNADMDATVNVGLGSGSRDRDMMFLRAILEQQQGVLGMVGGVVTGYGKKIAKAIHFTMQKMVEAAGLKSPETYFPELAEEELQEIAKAAAQSNPEAQKAQAQLQIEQVKAESQGKLKQAEMEAQAQLDQRKAEQSAQIEQLQAEADVAVKQRETEANIELKEREFNAKLMLEQTQFENEWKLKLLEHDLRVKEADHKHEAAMAIAKTKQANGQSAQPS